MTTAEAPAGIWQPAPGSLADNTGPIIVASHERSGTHLTMDSLRRNVPACRPRMRPLEAIHASYLSVDRFLVQAHRPVERAEAERILAKCPRQLLKSHIYEKIEEIRDHDRAWVTDLLARSTPIYCVRNGFKVMASLYEYSAHLLDPVPANFSEWLRQPWPDGRPPTTRWDTHIRTWTAMPGVHVVKFESLVKDTDATLRAIADHCGLEVKPADPPLPSPIRGRLAAWKARLFGNLESTNIAGKRPTKKPAELFKASDIDLFLEHCAGAMELLGYSTEMPT